MAFDNWPAVPLEDDRINRVQARSKSPEDAPGGESNKRTASAGDGTDRGKPMSRRGLPVQIRTELYKNFTRALPAGDRAVLRDLSGSSHAYCSVEQAWE
jgi:hypothetical protein